MKTVNTIFFFLILSVIAVGQSVTQKDAANVAENFFKHQYFRTYQQKSEKVISEMLEYKFNNQSSLYVANFENGGFVILSSENTVFPIIGYSYVGKINLNQLPVQMQEWLDGQSAQIIEARNSSNKSIHPLWNTFSNESNYSQSKNIRSVNPLLTTTWGQGNPYNMYCPQVPATQQRTVVGCVALAMGQVMKYYNYPEQGVGEGFTFWTDTMWANYGETTYRWSEMTDVANDQSKDAIATLLFHCGVSVYMNYGVNGSGTQSDYIPWALINNFKYHPSTRHFYRGQYADTIWDSMIRDNIDLNHPVVYSGSGAAGGHAFVCDGYQDTCFYHFNWGWDGMSDGYYYYNDLTPGTSDFNAGQSAVVNIFPYNADYCKTGKTFIEQFRSFDDGSGTSKYRNSTNCSWLIQPDSVETITLGFANFNTESGTDIVTIYDGADASAPVLGQYSGSILPTPVTTTGPIAFVTFTSDGQNQFHGWEIAYTSKVILESHIIFENSKLIKVYPNPANDNITISSEFSISKVEIVDITGKSNVISTGFNRNNINISLSELTSGVYFIKVYDNDNVHVSRLIVQ